MNHLLPLALGLTLVLSGCASAPPADEDFTRDLIAKVQAPELVDDAFGWIQPTNQPVACKLANPPMRKGLAIAAEATWDGKCQAGYAVDIGGEIMTNPQGRRSTVVTYKGGEVDPEYHYVTQDNPALVIFGDVSKGYLMLVDRSEPWGRPELSLATMLREADGTLYTHSFAPRTGDTLLVKQFPSGYELIYPFPANPQDPLAVDIVLRQGETYVGYDIRHYKNGSVQTLRRVAGVASTGSAPEAYLRLIGSTLVQIRQKTAAALQQAEASASTTLAYKAATCGPRGQKAGTSPMVLCDEGKLLARYAASLKTADLRRERGYTHYVKTKKVPKPWLKALLDYNAGTPRPVDGLSDAVAQYVQSVTTVNVMVGYLEAGAGSALAQGTP